MHCNQYIGINSKAEILSLTKTSSSSWEKEEMEIYFSKYNLIAIFSPYCELVIGTEGQTKK